MTHRQALLRRAAVRDIAEAVAHYYQEDGSALAAKFVTDLERALTHISSHLESGSPRYGQELGIPDLRSWSLSTFPHVVFYRVTPEQIDVARVLHARRDIASWLLTKE